MIYLVRKIIAAVSTATAFLSVTATAFADGTPIQLQAPAQAIPNVAIENVPRFLIFLLFTVAIIIAIVFLIYGGIKWILSGGDSKQVEGARNHIVAAIVGLIIVVGAFVILNIVFTILSGHGFDFNHLCIPTLQDPTCSGAKAVPGA